jgi:hypothetical protein
MAFLTIEVEAFASGTQVLASRLVLKPVAETLMERLNKAGSTG